MNPNVGPHHLAQPWQQQPTAGPGPSSTAAAAYSSQFTSRTGGSAPTVRSLDDWDFADDDLYSPYPSNTPVNEGAGGAATMTGTATDCLDLWTLPDRVPQPAAPARWEGLSKVSWACRQRESHVSITVLSIVESVTFMLIHIQQGHHWQMGGMLTWTD